MSTPPQLPASFEPNVSRVYDYYLGGAANFAADRDFANQVLSVLPEAAEFARRNRQFLNRAVQFLAREVGIRQFLDLGSGLPTVGNVHTVAHSINDDALVAYVDHDPVTVQHAHLQLGSDPRVCVLEHDLTDVGAIVDDLRGFVDFEQPIAVLLFAVLHFVPDGVAGNTVATYQSHMPTGSWIALSHVANELTTVDNAARMYNEHELQARVRSRDEIWEFFDGFDLVPPGLVLTPQWRPETSEATETAPTNALAYGGVARLREEL